MFVPRLLVVVIAIAALAFGGGCRGNNSAITPDETTDPVYQQAQDLKKQGRYGEALTTFLRVIERRGEAGAPESHLEAGALYLTWSKDPVEAYHHFGKYLELQPSSPRAEFVRGQREVARREFARTLPGGGEDIMRFQRPNEEVDQLRRRVQELEAEVQTLRGISSVPVRRAPTVISLGDDAAPAPVPVEDADAPFVRPVTPSRSVAATEPPPGAEQAVTPNRSVPTPPSRPTTTATTPARRTHTVRPRESLWAIARQYYGSGTTAAKVQGIYLANQDVMRHEGDVRPGQVLRIP